MNTKNSTPKSTESANARARRTAPVAHVALAVPSKTPPEADAHKTMLAQWEETRSEREAFPPEKLRVARVDLTNAVQVMQGACARVLPMKERIERELPVFEMRHLERLDTYCGAALYADALVRAIVPEASAAGLLSTASALSKKFGNAARSLADEGLFPIEVLEEIERGVGTRDTADDLRTYAATVSKNWEAIKGNTVLKEHDLSEAVRLANELLAYMERKDRPATPSELHMERRKSLLLALDSYEHVRRAVGWLRWFEGDADEIAPSAMSSIGGRPSGKRAASEEGEGEGEKDEKGDAKPAEGEAKEQGAKEKNETEKNEKGAKEKSAKEDKEADDDGPHGPPGSITNPFMR